MPHPSINKICLKITCLKFHSNFQGVNELKTTSAVGIQSTAALKKGSQGLIFQACILFCWKPLELELQKYPFNLLNHIHIWQCSRGDTCKIFNITGFDCAKRRKHRDEENLLGNPQLTVMTMPQDYNDNIQGQHNCQLILIEDCRLQGLPLLAWINFNPSMDK